MFGFLSWCIAIIVSVTIFISVNRFLAHYFSGMSAIRRFFIAVCLPAIITDILIHIVIIIESGYSEMMMWASISFPFVGICLLFVNFIALAIYKWKQRP